MITLFTLLTNWGALALSLWLGLYLITRSPRRSISWLTAATIWAMALFHLYNIFAIHPLQHDGWTLLRPIALLGLPTWLHVSLLLRQEIVPFPPSARRRQRAILALIYLSTLLVLAFGGFSSDPAQEAGPLYPLVLLLVLLTALLFSLNLWHCWRSARQRPLRRVFALLLIGTTTTAIGGVLHGVLLLFFPQIPLFLSDGLMNAAVLSIGYAIARYDAFLVGQQIKRDLLYSLSGVALATGVLALLMLMLVWQGQATVPAFVLLTAAAIGTHALYDGARSALDRLFYRGQVRQLRVNLRALAGHTECDQGMTSHLQALLEATCQLMGTAQALLALHEQERGYVVYAAIGTGQNQPPTVYPAAQLSATALTELTAEQSRSLNDLHLLVPLFAANCQIGALLFGARPTQRPYHEDELQLLEDLADQLAAAIYELQSQHADVQQISRLMGDVRQREQTLQRQLQRIHGNQPEPDLGAWEEWVETALRHLHDYAFLGEHPLAALTLVDRQVPNTASHAARGKVLSENLIHALQQLRPDGPEPIATQTPSRAWHLFLALYDPYVRNRLTREVWLRLDVSEKTFHRTRRRAIHAVVKILYEHEQQALQHNAVNGHANIRPQTQHRQPAARALKPLLNPTGI